MNPFLPCNLILYIVAYDAKSEIVIKYHPC